MDLSLAPSLNGWSAGRWLPQLEVDTCLFDFASIPDPLRLRHEGVVIRRNEDATEGAVSDWCDRAHQCLRFLAATDPSRIWIWQEQVRPILLALSSTLAARRAGLSAPGDLGWQRIADCGRSHRAIGVPPEILGSDRQRGPRSRPTL
jgi:hypothetical protein